MEIRPAFYDDFACLAGRCRHSCCRGWEIDVDPDARRLYQTLPGPLGDELRAALQEQDGTWSFRLTESRDCPFLRSDGLCRLILALGEDSLCDICALHPRFYQDVGEHELAGLGLCCEAAARLLLESPGELLFLTEDDRPVTMEGLLRLLGQEPAPDALRFTPRIDGDHYATIFRRYGPCEAIDDAWTEDLAALAADPASAAARAAVYAGSCDRQTYDRIFSYILYRQLEFLDAYGLAALVSYAREAADFIFLWTAVTGDLPACLRRWSAQTEYSDENVGYLLKSHAGIFL